MLRYTLDQRRSIAIVTSLFLIGSSQCRLGFGSLNYDSRPLFREAIRLLMCKFQTRIESNCSTVVPQPFQPRILLLFFHRHPSGRQMFPGQPWYHPTAQQHHGFPRNAVGDFVTPFVLEKLFDIVAPLNLFSNPRGCLGSTF